MLSTVTMLAVLTAAPMQLDLSALKAGQLPATGTMAEADTCAAETTYMFMGLSGSDTLSDADKKTRLTDPWKAWTARAAEPRGVTSTAYINDDAVVAATISLAEVPADTHFDLHKLCRERLTTSAPEQ